MNELRIFSNPEFGEVRTAIIRGKIYFAGVDIARALGYSNTRDAISRHCKHVVKHDGVIQTTNQHGTVATQTVEMSYIPEGDVYRLIIRSQLPNAEKFELWVFDEVLPEIRKSGKYEINQKPDSYMIDDKVERAKRWIEEQEEKNREIQIRDDRITELEPKAMICDEMISSNMLMSFRDAAYILGISQSQFTGWLEENGYVYRNADNLLRPTEKYRNSGLFEVKPFRSRSSHYTGAQTHITAKGLAVFKVILNSAGHTQDTLPKHGGRKPKKNN